MLDEIVAYNEQDFSLNSRYLWVWNPTAIPPHMGLSIDGHYFSLKANGVDLGSNLNDLIEIVLRKKIPVLALELTAEFTAEECLSIFSTFERTIAHEVTCLNPIKSVFNIHSPSKLSELLAELQAKSLIRGKFGLNIDKTSVDLPEYSIEDIHAHLVSLSK